MQRRIAAIVLVAGSLLWIGLILAAPYGRAQDWSAASWIYLFFQRICHQMPERSFHMAGEPLAVCHRCFGIYLGFLAGALLLPFWQSLRRLLLAHPRLLLVGFALLATDVFLLPNTWWSRFVTGFAAAFPTAVFAEIAFREMLEGRTQVQPGTETMPARE